MGSKGPVLIDIIGGSGFIGTRLATMLNADPRFNFIIIDKVETSKFKKNYVYGDVESLETLEKAVRENTIIVNLAAEHKDNIRPLSRYFDVNVKGARNVCSVARLKNCKKIIFTSSAAVYGVVKRQVDETSACHPFNVYGQSKLEAESEYLEWQKENINHVLRIVRPTVVFGEGNKGNIYNLINQIRKRRFIFIGKGSNKKSIAYVENVSNYLIHLITNESAPVVSNYSDKPDLSTLELVRKINLCLGRKPEPLFKLPLALGYAVASVFDLLAFFLKKDLVISRVRINKFVMESCFSSIHSTHTYAKVDLEEALKRTIKNDF